MLSEKTSVVSAVIQPHVSVPYTHRNKEESAKCDHVKKLRDDDACFFNTTIRLEMSANLLESNPPVQAESLRCQTTCTQLINDAAPLLL